MHSLMYVVESKPEVQRNRGASRPAGRGRTTFLALVFAAVTLSAGACGDDDFENVTHSSADSEHDADDEATRGSHDEATGGADHDMTGGAEGEWHDCGSEDWETGDFPGGESTGHPDGESSSSSGASEEPDDPDGSLCTQTGGTESVGFCCGAVSDFPSSCVDGACGCAPEYSHEVKTCHCPAGQCYDPAVGCTDQL